MFGSQKTQGRRQVRRFTGAFIGLMVCLAFYSGASATALDDGVAELADKADRHSESIKSLEYSRLATLGTRVTVFLTLDAADGLELDSLELLVDNRPVAFRLFSPREQSAQKVSGMRPFYAGHLGKGQHELKAVVTARSANRDFVRREAVHPFSKQRGELAIQLSLTAGAPAFEPRFSFAEVDPARETRDPHFHEVGSADDQHAPDAKREDRHRAGYELAEKHRRAGAFRKAGEALAAMPEGYWAAAGYLNLASDFSREDIDPSRALVALRVAMAMAGAEEDNERGRHLRDQALLRAGYLAYRNGELDKAIGFLESVSLDSPSTPRALYFHGLALAEKGNHRAAMQSWHRARKFPLAYPGVAEAWIGMGRGYDLAGFLGQAGEAFLAANAAYESERVVLQALMDQVRDEGAYQALVTSVKASDLEWFLADSRSLQQPRLAYLLEFLRQPTEQRAVGRVATLAAIEQRLNTHAHDLEVFTGALSSSPGSVTEATASEVTQLLQANGRHLAQLADLLSAAEDELDKQVLAYLERQDQRMVSALDRTEQQIAHLYEYLALESLGGSGS